MCKGTLHCSIARGHCIAVYMQGNTAVHWQCICKRALQCICKRALQCICKRALQYTALHCICKGTLHCTALLCKGTLHCSVYARGHCTTVYMQEDTAVHCTAHAKGTLLCKGDTAMQGGHCCIAMYMQEDTAVLHCSVYARGHCSTLHCSVYAREHYMQGGTVQCICKGTLQYTALHCTV